MTYSINKIREIINGISLQSKASERKIIHLAFDSRRIQQARDTLFFAFVTERADGHKYLQEVYNKGVRCFVVSRKVDLSGMPEAEIILVSDTLLALQNLAAYHRQQCSEIKIIAITGSNGKTIVKEWLYEILRKEFGKEVMRSPKSYNSQIGVALSVWQIRATDKFAIIEAGISKKGDMDALKKIIGDVHLGIFTNLYAAHDSGFADRHEKFSEKFSLFDKNTNLISSQKLMNEFPNHSKVNEIITFGNAEADLKIIKSTIKDNKRIVEAQYKNQKINFTIPFIDGASFENVLLCFLAASEIDIDSKKIFESIARLEPIEMRLSVKTGVNNCIIIDDAYSNDFNSLGVALDFMIQQSGNHERTIILSDILESNVSDEILYKQVADLLVIKGVSKIISIGKKIKLLKKYLNLREIIFFNFISTEKFLDSFQKKSSEKNIFPEKKIENEKYFSGKKILKKNFEKKFQNFSGEIILIKGARIFGFERISNLLEEKVHETILEINLSALIHNFQTIKQTLRPETQTMAMVKASAYGAGGDEIARALAFNKVNYLAVAYADEGVALRQAKINIPIMVMNPEPISFPTMIRHNLEPEIYSLRIFRSYQSTISIEHLALSHESYVEETQSSKLQVKETQNSKLKAQTYFPAIHLKLNTGMNRLGFDAADLEELKILLETHPEIKIASIFTHLAATDDEHFDDFTHEQVEKFCAMYETIASSLNYKPMRHVLNSNGTLRFPAFQFEMVRLGIALYGVGDEKNNNSGLQIVSSLKATISQIRKVPKTETVGYSRKGKLERDTVIATISIGYADGLHRKAGNKNFSVWVHEKLAPIIGNVCMDMTMIDITDIPEAKEGDKVEVFGTHIPVQTLAYATDTIPYEIFTSISSRVKRVYFQEWQ